MLIRIVFTPATSRWQPASETPNQIDQRAIHSVKQSQILIEKSRRQLSLLQGGKVYRQYPVAIGKPGTPTPVGNYAVASKIMNPGGMLGTRWLGLNYDSYGIHGTSKPWLIGQQVSGGCIRMHNAHVEELFALTILGTPVAIRD